MIKLIKRVTFCMLLAALVWCGTLIADRQRLNEDLIRLHVVANSDSQEDQQLKMHVKEAITDFLSEAMGNIPDADQARAYLRENLPKLQQIAQDALAAAGCGLEVVVSFAQEAFDTRFYDTFALPAGLYDSLRIVIGAGDGQNWWCVVFPSLCVPVTSDGFKAEAAGAGFPDALTDTLEGKAGCEIRFFLLDVLGKLENIFHRG